MLDAGFLAVISILAASTGIASVIAYFIYKKANYSLILSTVVFAFIWLLTFVFFIALK